MEKEIYEGYKMRNGVLNMTNNTLSGTLWRKMFRNEFGRLLVGSLHSILLAIGNH
jgi:hypothetical protein